MVWSDCLVFCLLARLLMREMQAISYELAAASLLVSVDFQPQWVRLAASRERMVWLSFALDQRNDSVACGSAANSIIR